MGETMTPQKLLRLRYEDIEVIASQEVVDAANAYAHAVNRQMQKADPEFAWCWTGAVIEWSKREITAPRIMWMSEAMSRYTKPTLIQCAS